MPAAGIRLFDTHAAKAEALAADLGPGALAAPSAQAAVAGADLVLLAVKPPMVAEVLTEIASALSPAQLVISIAAGVRLEKMEALLPGDIPVIRTMPNTPCLVGKGATALCRGVPCHRTASAPCRKPVRQRRPLRGSPGTPAGRRDRPVRLRPRLCLPDD